MRLSRQRFPRPAPQTPETATLEHKIAALARPDVDLTPVLEELAAIRTQLALQQRTPAPAPTPPAPKAPAEYDFIIERDPYDRIQSVTAKPKEAG